MHKAIMFKKIGDGKVLCTACKQACKILPDMTGICGVRYNKDGTLYLLVYGKASAFNIDPIEKKPLFHFLPTTPVYSIGTVGCNFRCQFCQNWDLSQCTKISKERLIKEKKIELLAKQVESYGQDLPPEKIVKECLEQNIPTIAYTYNEPAIFFEYVYDTAKLAKKHGLKNVMVSSGYETDEALEKLKPYIDAINYDLKSFNDEFYKKVCGARLQPVLDTIKKSYELGTWIEVTTLVIPGKNDSNKELTQIAKFIADIDKNIPWHISAFYPCYKMLDVPPTDHKTLIRAYDIGKKAGLNYIYLGNVLDEERSSTYCPKCKELLIKRIGYTVEVTAKDGKCKCGEKIPGVWK